MSVTVLANVHHREANFPLNPAIISQLWRMEDLHFWHHARNDWIRRALLGKTQPHARFLEVGCGSGAVARHLHRSGYAVTGVDTAEVLVRKADERVPEAAFFVGRVEDMPPCASFDVIGMFDVLEHVDEPLALLRSALMRGRPGTWVITTVPAMARLFSAVDVVSGHRRRYELGVMSSLFLAAGLERPREYGIFRYMTPLLALSRRKLEAFPVDDQRKCEALMLRTFDVPAAPVNRALSMLSRMELLRFDRALGRPGPSILAIAQVPAIGSPGSRT